MKAQDLFKEKGYNTFNSQRSSEYISYEPTVVGPVRTELKFKNKSGGNPYGEIDTKEFHPELGRILPKRIARLHINGFHNGLNDAKT